MIVVYALTLDLLGEAALAEADKLVSALAVQLDPESALVRRSTSDTGKPAYSAAGLLHGGEPRLTDRISRFPDPKPAKRHQLP